MQVQMERSVEIAPAVMEGALKAMYGREVFVARSGIEKPLLELVKPRASQLNGCAYCIDMHTKDARARGESEQRLAWFPPGASRPCTATASGRRSTGPKS